MYTKNLFLTTFFVGISMLSSCTQDDVVERSNTLLSTIDTHEQGGYLIFENENSFNSYIEKIKEEENESNSATRSYKRSQTASTKNFRSIADLKEKISHSTRAIEYKIDNFNDDDDEEMTAEEFNIMKAENILVDPVLTHVMDTTLRIQIGNTLYKITEKGTFYTNEENKKFLEENIRQFDNKLVLEGNNANQELALNDGVYVIPAENHTQKSNTNFNTSSSVAYKKQSAENKMELELHKGYNTEDFVWKNHSIWQKFWDMTLGKSVDRERNFDKKHRVQVEVFNINYKFYTSAGIKVKMQKRKKFLFAKYWVSDNCEDMAIGFNMMTGKLKFNNPTSYSSITPSNSVKWDQFTSTINGYERDFLYQRIYNASIVKDWINPVTDKLYMILPHIKLKNPINTNKYLLEFPTPSVLQSIYDAPFNSIVPTLLKINGKTWSMLEGKIKPEDPRIAYLVWGNNEETFDKAKPFISGVKRYGSTSTKVVRFNQSFGFSYIGILKPFLPSEFKIEHFDGFGAVKYNGQWLGIRFIGEGKSIW